MHKESELRPPLILGEKTWHDITEDVCRPVESKANKWWKIAFTVAVAGLLWWIISVSYTLGTGLGVWGLNKTVGWAWDITNFVWWVGIGHAGTLISAILLLFRQKWRLSINRSAEAMTIFAVICAATFILSHMGRPWVGYWPIPLPNQYGSLWVNFNSPLVWDVFAISTYFSVSIVFWYTGLIPDFAVIRDRTKTKWSKRIYTILSFGWVGTAKNWQRFEEVSLVLAGLSTPLVLSVHSVVSMDFATSIVPGWHTTIFPPYFVAGAIFSGFAMVQTLLIIVRKVLTLEDYITIYHIDMMNRVILITGSIVGVAYLTEFFIAWYSGVEYEQYAFINRATGPYWWAYWSMMTCNVITPQLFWSSKLRENVFATFIISIFVNIGMWFERFVIIVTSLHRDYVTSSWTMYSPTWVEAGIFIGSIGLFFTCFLLFARVFPVIAMSELKTIVKSSSEGAKKNQIIQITKTNTYERCRKKFVYGIFNDDDVVVNAIGKLRSQGLKVKDVISPFPIHGLDHELGLARTRISICAFLYGMTGLSLALLMIYYMNIFDWPMDIGGKPSFAFYKNLPAFIPVTFESTVLCAAHGMVITFLLRSKILPGVEPHVIHPRMADDHFVMVIQVKDDTDIAKVESLVKAAGAVEFKS